MTQLPYLTADLPGIGGKIKQQPEDFSVDEIPLYPLSGEGTHVFFRVTKKGVPTPAAADRIARHMGVSVKSIGVAGLKDSNAVTTQWMSIEHADIHHLEQFSDPKVAVSGITRHTNKLKLGHLAGNRFGIKVRDIDAQALERAKQVMDILVLRGVPNFFGPQRFGLRGDTGQLGRALVMNKLDDFTRIFLGEPSPADPPDIREARKAFDAGDYDRAYDAWPGHYADQRKALRNFRKRHDPQSVVASVDWRLRRLFVSAFQSEVFNRVLEQRLHDIDRVQPGDLAQKTGTGGIFLVEDVQAEQPRCERFEISPTGPVPGYRCRLAEGEAGQIERQVMQAMEIENVEIRRVGKLEVRGARRALRFGLTEPELSQGTDEHGEFLSVAFAAPSGCYATIVLGEIMKVDPLGRGGDDQPGEAS